MRLSTACRNDGIAAIGARFNNGTLQFRVGAAPANVGDPLSGVLLGTCGFQATAFQAAANGGITANTISSDVDVDATGTCGYAAVLESDGTTVAALLSVGLTGSGADIELDSLSFEAGGVVNITGGNLTLPIGS
ncbi:hypothetical protein FLL45_01615 [Aliikangiella marina]|uniref:Uncharacterized protein n=1 Tax=Aliikangiella marina TaxID=1712262 RepID=A0A545THJ9_9GAMM|nr:hypothetical protein [Aliikangiella marina]TQV76685.1 hypothetical protein FLL45_01615 [Aliikangiella marina]